MTLDECYAAMGSDYQEVLTRLRSEALIRKYAVRFLDDPSYESLCQALADGRGEEAFRAAHTLKGVCQNLGFTRLYEASYALTEALRGREIPKDDGLVRPVVEAYRQTADLLAALRDGAE